jgi:bacillithiol biosynthesis deacetylase BshB1
VKRPRGDRDAPPSGLVEVLAVGAHPDDVELGCGGTLALLAAQGRRVGIVHLTRGELGTRGTPEQRADEARRAGAALGAASVELLDCGDGMLRHGVAEEDALIAVLRRRRPEIVLAPPPHDRHPDHGRAHRLVVDAAFYAGLRRRAPDTGPAHRPAALFCYAAHDLAVPTFVVDVTAVWERKLAALAAYRTQLHQPGAPLLADPQPMTKISSPQFALSVEARARACGIVIGVDLGEAFWSPAPLAVADLWSLRPAGLR